MKREEEEEEEEKEEEGEGDNGKRGIDLKLQVAGFVDSERKSATKLDLHVNSARI